MRRLINITREQIVVEHLDLADTWWTRFRGLMMRRALPPDAGLLIEPCTSIHMMWMRFPIDAIWLDSERRVAKVSRGIPPWIGLARGDKGSHAVVELPRGAADSVQPGDQLAIEAHIATG